MGMVSAGISDSNWSGSSCRFLRQPAGNAVTGSHAGASSKANAGTRTGANSRTGACTCTNSGTGARSDRRPSANTAYSRGTE